MQPREMQSFISLGTASSEGVSKTWKKKSSYIIHWPVTRKIIRLTAVKCFQLIRTEP